MQWILAILAGAISAVIYALMCVLVGGLFSCLLILLLGPNPREPGDGNGDNSGSE